MNLSCDVISDLLPSYMEDLTSEESSRLIQEHLQGCPECQALFEDMKKDMQIEQEIKTDIAPLKKYRRWTRILKWLVIVLSVLLISAVLIGTMFNSFLNYHRMWMEKYPSKIEALFAVDEVTGQQLIFPFAYEEGAYRSDFIRYDKTCFFSDETPEQLVDRINEWGLKDCTARVIGDTKVLISYGDSYYQMYQMGKDSEEWYNWRFEGLACRFERKSEYYQFPLHLCQSVEEALQWDNMYKGDLKTIAKYQDFVNFYKDTGMYRIAAADGTILILGYAGEAPNDRETSFPLIITFVERDGVLTISVR